MTMFKYGQNPQDIVLQAKIPSLDLLPAGALSLNAYLDINCGYAMAGTRTGQLVYCKHAAPVFALKLGGSDWTTRLERYIALNAERDFGTFVYNGQMTVDILDAIAGLRFHTLAATSATDQAIAVLDDPGFQARNRGVLFALGDFDADPSRIIRLASAHHQIEYALESPAGDEFACFMERIIRELRTLAAAVFVGEDLARVACGYFDPIELVEHTLAPFEGCDDDLVFASDACFSVKDPSTLLRAANVTTLHLFGGKGEHVGLVDTLRRNGMAAELHPHRAFRY